MDIWCPTVAEYEGNKAFYTSRVEKGEKLWVYTCLTPGGNYCNRLLDMERLRQVWLGWSPMRYPHISGYLHWGGTFYQKEGVFHRQCAFFLGKRPGIPSKIRHVPSGRRWVYLFSRPQFSVDLHAK